MKNEFIGTEEEKYAFKSAIDDPEYINADTFRSQICIIGKYVRTDTINVSFDRIGKVFDEPGSFNRGPTLDGRPPKLNDSQISTVKHYIEGFISEGGHLKYPLHIQMFLNLFQKILKSIYYQIHLDI